MAEFQNVAEIERAIKKGLNAVAASPYFIGQIKTDLSNAIWERVYSFPAGHYERRYEQGGLGDKRLFELTKGKAGAASLGSDALGDDDFMAIPDVSGDADDFLSFYDSGSSGGGLAGADGISVTIEMQATAPPTGAPGYGSLDYMVENGIGKGNMRTPRPFYQPADEIVQADEGYLSDLAARIINQYL